MLDDLKQIHHLDAQDTLGISERQWQQLSYEVDTTQKPIDVDNIIYAGMGGSSLAALLSESWPGYNLPFEVLRGYDVPAYTSERTYFIAASYSGNTEETLSALAQAEAKGAKIAIIAGGGKLAEIAKDKGYPLAVLPKAEQPRYVIFYNLRLLVLLLKQAGLLSNDRALEELEEAGEFLKKAVHPWLPVIPTAKNPAKQIALEVIGKSAVIYAGPMLMKDEKGRTELAEKAHKYALANFSIDAHIFRLKELYERLIRV